MHLTSSQKLQVVLNAAHTTSPLPVTAAWVDVATDGSTYAPGGTDTQTNGSTAVDVVAAPAASTVRQLKGFSVYNADTVSAIVFVRLVNGATNRNLLRIVLPVNYSIEFTPDQGFRVRDSNGALLTSQGTSVAGGSAGRHAIPFMAGAIQPSASGGCSAVQTLASAANQPDIITIDFDPSTREYAQFSFPMPKSWNGGSFTFIPIWSHGVTTVNFGVVFDLQLLVLRNDDAIASAYGTAQTSTDVGGTTNDIYYGPESAAITPAGTVADDCIVFGRISRVVADAADTMAIDARLHGILLFATTDAETDA